VGIYPEFIYQAERYRAGMYAEGIRRALLARDKIKECLNFYRDAEHKIPESEPYWPVSVFCETCGKDTTVVDSFDGDWGLGYHCTGCGASEVIDIRASKGVKLGWRVDWPMRWEYEKTLFEPAGKDHHSYGGSFDTAKLVSEAVYGWKAPESFQYDFIGIKGAGGKMSSSKGDVITLKDVLEVYQPEVARYLFAGVRPNTEFSISFDLDVLKTYEDYDRTERIAWGVEKAKSDEAFKKERRIYELSQVDGLPPVISYQIPFRHLCNRLQAAAGDIGTVIASLEDLNPGQVDRLRTRCECAWAWITGYAPPEFTFTLRRAGEKAALPAGAMAALRGVYTEILPVMDSLDEKALSHALYAQAEAAGIDSRELFAAMYQALIAKDQGPRLAGFMKIIGREGLEKLLGVYA
jgi:lysyl-tRNA synthetase class 1